MPSLRLLNFGSSLVLVGAAVCSTVACTPSEPVQRPNFGAAGGPGTTTTITGTAGTSPPFVPPPTMIADGGVAIGVDGSTCVNGVAVAPPRPPGGGPQPTIPSTPTKAATSVPPISGGTLMVMADGKTAVASDPDRDQVYLVDLASKTVRATVLIPGDEPGRLAEDGAGRIHVALRRGGAVVTIDPKTATVTARQAICPAPRGLAYQAAGDLVHVACAGGELVSLPAAGGAATRSLTLDRDLRDVVVTSSGSLLVSTFRKAEVLVVGADGNATSRLQPGSGTAPPVFGPPQTKTPSVAWRIVPYSGIVDSSDGGVASGDGVVMLHQTGVTDSIDPAAGGYAGLKGCGGIVQPAISILIPGAAPPPVAGGLGSLSLVVDIAISPDKSKIAVASAGNADTPGMPTLVEGTTSLMTQGAGMGPCGPPTINVPSAPSGQVVSVAYSQSGVLFAQTREPAALWSSDTGTTITLASDSRADTGHLIFHANAGGGLACASCHPEGGEDGRTWNFVCAGARRTQSIRGGISATAPFHWDGSEHDFSHLMDDVFSGRMAGPQLSADQKTALQSWVDTIPLLPATAGLDAAAVVRGSMLFNDPNVGCATCHAGSLLTNNTTVDVGTGQPLQVPSLRGVSWRGPFMHNGCAATLTARFTNPTCGGGDKHGLTSTLTNAQISDLTTYLQSL
jgi:mono/diheme cytochrome c family protein